MTGCWYESRKFRQHVRDEHRREDETREDLSQRREDAKGGNFRRDEHDGQDEAGSHGRERKGRGAGASGNHKDTKAGERESFDKIDGMRGLGIEES